MTPHCASIIRAAANGRDVSDAKLRTIEERLDATHRQLARDDAARWRSLTPDQRMAEASQRAMQDIAAESARAKRNAALQVVKQSETDARVERLGTVMKAKHRTDAYVADLVNTHDYANGVRNEMLGKLTDLMDAAASRDGTGLFRNLGMRVFDLDNPQMTADVVREVFKLADGHTGNKQAQAAAKAWLETIEGGRLRFNAAGGDVGKLDYGYLGQAHDAARVRDAGADAWARFVLDENLLDRTRYLNRDGSLMTPEQVLDFLRAAHETIATSGANKTEPGAFQGTGARANRGSDHRVLHFKGGDEWIAYMRRFGDGSLYDAMLQHVNGMSRDIALVEQMGPNPSATHRRQVDIARRQDAPTGQRAGEIGASRVWGNTPDAYWRLISGDTGSPESRWLANFGQDVRNVQTAAKITWGPLAALSDVATVLQTLHFDKIAPLEYLRAYGRQFDKAHREALKSHGIIAESLIHSVNRWAGDYVGQRISSHVTNGVMKMSLMNAWTDAARTAFSDVLMRNFAGKLGKTWQQLDGWDRFRLERKGITEADWQIITQAQPATRAKLLTPRAVAEVGGDGAAQAAAKWGGFIADESEFAVVNPDLAARAIVTGGAMKTGTPSGEIVRSVMQFKSFPIAMLTRHWGRIFETPQGIEGAPAGFGAGSGKGAAVNRIALLAALGVTTTLLGALQTQSRQVAVGKDPIDMTGEHAGKFWGKAFAAGGGAGFLADVLLAPGDDPSRQWGGHLGLLGPAAGAAGGLIDIAKDKKGGATALRVLNDQIPGVDIWYMRAAYEHWFLHNAQEFLNPGYLSRMEQRTRRDWGQEWWWSPGEALPDRAPDLGAAVGR